MLDTKACSFEMKRPAVEMRTRRRPPRTKSEPHGAIKPEYPCNIFVMRKVLTLILYCRVSTAVLWPCLHRAINHVCSNVYKLPLNESNQISLLTHDRRAYLSSTWIALLFPRNGQKTRNGRTFND